MVSLLPQPLAIPPRELIARLLAMGALLLLAGFLLSTYVGHAPGPYGACYAASGRAVPCDLAVSGRSAHRPLNER